MQEKPALWSTALMWLVAELFEALPEAGDLPQPKLVVFLDEAHLLFDDATEAFLDALERTVRLIRSKGVGVFFVTQQPTDLSEEVLAQLGLRIQHALRAFTPGDAKKLRATVSTYPTSELYDVETLLTSVGIGEAAVTLLSEKGVPTPVVHTRLLAPSSSMDPADDVDGAAKASPLWAKYGDAGRRAERARDPRRAAGRPEPEREPEPDLRAPMEHVPAPRQRRRAPAPARGRAPTRSATSCARARARRCSARSRAASSGCCASGSSRSGPAQGGDPPAVRQRDRPSPHGGSGGCGNAAQPRSAKPVQPARLDAEVGDREQPVADDDRAARPAASSSRPARMADPADLRDPAARGRRGSRPRR